ncbi:MAG: polysaccharide pyruvyl transferase family protein [Eubacterium sp.]
MREKRAKMFEKLKIYLSEFSYAYRNELKVSNGFILNDKNRLTTANRVNLHRWLRDDGKENLGDYLSEVIVDYMLNRCGIDRNKHVKNTKHLYAVGSILHMGLQNATVWGSGYKYDITQNPVDTVYEKVNDKIRRMRKLDIRCVRGPETRRVLLKLGYKCPEVYGDPAVLMPYIYKPENAHKTRKYSVIRHWRDNSEADNTIQIMTTDYKSVIDAIDSSEVIVSSSLHGIILAESYGVPAVLYIPPECVGYLDEFKYRDYYYSTGRYQFPVAKSVKEALQTKPCELSDLKHLQENLLKTFPSDLWNR